MDERIIAHAALAATDDILELVRNHIPDGERADLFREVFARCKAGIEAAICYMEGRQERLNKPGKN
jgi:hypothetical protein